MVSDPDTDDEQTWQQARPTSLEGSAAVGTEHRIQRTRTERMPGVPPEGRSEVQTLERMVWTLLVLVVVSIALSTVAIVLLLRHLS